MPPCIQYLTKGVIPVYASAWAISASWCGNINSVAPPWRSYCGPKCRIVIAVSSMCLPGPPQDEVGGMPFPFLDGDPGPRPERFDLLSAQLAPAGERRRVVVDAPVLGDVCVALLDQPLDLRDDVVDVIGCERVHVDRVAAEGVHDLEVFAEILVDDVLPLPSGLLHLLDNPVLDVRDILQVEHMVSLVSEEPRDDVERDVRLRVAHVRLVLRGEAADEHGYAVRLEGNELLLRS